MPRKLASDMTSSIDALSGIKRFPDAAMERGGAVSEAQGDLELVLHDVHGCRDQIHGREVRFANDLCCGQWIVGSDKIV